MGRCSICAALCQPMPGGWVGVGAGPLWKSEFGTGAGRRWPQQLPAGLPTTTPAQPSRTPVSHLVGVVVGGGGERKATVSSLHVGCRDVGINHPDLVLLTQWIKHI